MTLIDDEAAAEAADALQAAYFRTSLCDERARLLAEISKRRTDIAARINKSDKGCTSAISRLRAHLRGVEAELHHLEGIIARLESRFACQSFERN